MAIERSMFDQNFWVATVIITAIVVVGAVVVILSRNYTTYQLSMADKGYQECLVVTPQGNTREHWLKECPVINP